jgi:hypothetical protein
VSLPHWCKASRADHREQKKRENHAKILVGVAMIHQCQISEPSAGQFKALLEEFYSDSPERLKASLFGLTLTAKHLPAIRHRTDHDPIGGQISRWRSLDQQVSRTFASFWTSIGVSALAASCVTRA